MVRFWQIFTFLTFFRKESIKIKITLADSNGQQAFVTPFCNYLRRGAFTCVWWHATLCNPVWQVTLRSSVMGFLLTWAAPEGVEGQVPPRPCPCSPVSPPRKNLDSDKVPSGNHTHAKV